ncbi:hypothetical protein Tco_0010915 [Tanacetum coccineum]
MWPSPLQLWQITVLCFPELFPLAFLLVISSGIMGSDDSSQKCHHIVDQLRKDTPIELSIVETDKVNHTVETNMMKFVVEIKCFGVNFDKFDKETGSSDELQPKQAGGRSWENDISYLVSQSSLKLASVADTRYFLAL